MSKATEKKIFYATRDFNDAGTEKAFKQGEPVEASEGEIANYAAAGLVADHKQDEQSRLEAVLG